MLRPGRLMRDYIDGRRGNHVKPLLLIMVSAAAVVLLNRFFAGGMLMDAGTPVGAAGSLEPGLTASAAAARYIIASQTVAGWVDAHFAAFTLALLPLEAWVLRLVFGRYGRLNYPEWLVVSAFLTVQSFVFMAIAIVLQRWIPSAQAWVLLCVVAYTVFSLVQLFNRHSGWTSALRALVGLGMFMVAQSLMVGAGVFVLFLLFSRG